jgi:flagellar FliL protein
MAERNTEGDKPAVAPAATGGGGGGIKAWLPLILTLVAMPALAFACTQYLIIPQVRQAMGHEGGAPAEPVADTHGAAGGGHGAAAAGGAGKAGAKDLQRVPLNKMVVNVSGTMGTRYLLSSITLVGPGPNFRTLVEDERERLLDLATGLLGTKSITDLEKPGARQQIRTELLSVFNNALGDNAIQELFITEMAIQ